METSLLRFIWHHSRRQQLVVILLTLLSFPVLYLSLELPKWIINDALSGRDMVHEFLGMSLEPVPFLAALCLLLLALIIVGGILKMRINTLKGIIGERLVRRLRYNLIHNLLRFPLPYFSRVSSGELISTVTSETEPLGGYIGESIALPLFQGGTMITILVFMFAQDWVFGLVSVALIPVQGTIIPRLQHKINLLKKERVRRVRKLSERIGETVSGATEIRLQGTQPYTLAEFSRRLGELFGIRLEIFRRKFFMKFLNNTIGQVTPFLFYLFGGYLVIKGDLTIGALVAAIGAYKDLTSPWNELLNFYQLHEDSRIKYQQILELFNPARLDKIDEAESSSEPQFLRGDITLENVSWRNDQGEQVLAGINLRVAEGSMVAVVGDFPIRRARLAQVLAGLESPWGGRIAIGGRDLAGIPDATLRRRLVLQRPDPHLFAGTIVDNMEYGLNQLEPALPEDGPLDEEIREAAAAGNRPPLDEGWIDYRQAGQESRERSMSWFHQVNEAVGSDRVIYERSLLEIFDPDGKPELARRLLEARRVLRDRLRHCGCSADISGFDPGAFNPHASIGENLLFGEATDDRLDPAALELHSWYLDVLERQGVMSTALTLGRCAATTLIGMIDEGTISPELVEHFALADEERVERIRETLSTRVPDDRLTEDGRGLLVSLFLQLVPANHGFVRFSHHLQDRLLRARHEFRDGLPEELRDSVVHFDPDQYHPRLTVLDNLLFGRVSTADPAVRRRVDAEVEKLIGELGLRDELNLLLGESQVGISGSRLPMVARHNITLTRNLLKRPDVLVFHDALGPYDTDSQAGIRKRVRALLPGATIIWIARDIPDPAEFDQVYRFSEKGPLVADGIVVPVDAQEAAKPGPTPNWDDIDLIAHSPLFTTLTPSQHRFLTENSRRVAVTADTLLYELNDHADAAWMMIEGEVHTRRDGIVVGRFRHPDTFGALEILADCPRILSATVKENSLLLRIDGAALERIALSDATVSRTLLRALSFQWRAQFRNDSSHERST